MCMTHIATRCRNINAEPLSADNAKLLECTEDDEAQPGQERSLVTTAPDSYNAHVKNVIKGTEIRSQLHYGSDPHRYSCNLCAYFINRRTK